MSKQFPSSQITSPKGTIGKGGLTKSSSQKNLELQQKFKLKSDNNSPKKDENLSLSFLLDQNISVDSINFPAGIMSGAATRELEGDYKRKGNLKEASNTSKTETSNISQRKVNNTSTMSKTMSDPNKNNKLKVPINTTPVTVKKKSTAEPK